jgi:hypothetical protein
MIRAIRAFFLARFVREKLLLTGFAVLAAAIWLSSLAGRTGRFLKEVRATTASLNEQALWISSKAKIEAQAQAAAGQLDAARTLDATRLLAEVAAIANDAGLGTKSSSGESQDQSNGQFSVHTLRFSVTRADWDSIKNFYLGLQKRSPYIGIEQFSLQSDRANAAFLNASIRISSVEIAKN